MITWISSSDLGKYASGNSISITLKATNATEFVVHNGSLPTGIKVSTTGVISGSLAYIKAQTKYVFTIRASNSSNEISDRTFSLTVGASDSVSFETTGLIITSNDAVWIDYQIPISNPANETYTVVLVGGNLPDGLYLTEAGRICGFATRPINTLTNLPEPKTSNFVLSVVSSDTGKTDTESFSIRINLSPSRIPVIMNKTPPINYQTSEYFAYYNTQGFLGSYKANEEIAFKVIGNDFSKSRINYEFSNLPTGLTGNIDTGWVTGVIQKSSQTYQRYIFTVRVFRHDAPSIASDVQKFSFILYNKIVPKITWKTDSVLPSHNTGEQCFVSLKVSAPTADVVFQKTSGQLPPNLTLQSSGELRGKTSFQPHQTLTKGTSKTYYFTVKAYSRIYPEIYSSRDFALTVNQPFDFPCDKIYLKASPTFNDKTSFSNFISDFDIFTDDSIFRATDPDFGVATDIRTYLSYGTKASNIDQYIDAMTTHFYTKTLYFGDIKTAFAKDDDGNIIYEVVYVELYDPQFNAPYSTTINDQIVFPNSFENMKTKLENTLGKNTDSSLIPRWMSTQQTNGNILGHFPCWVICYCNVGFAESVASKIYGKYAAWFKQIEFSCDRIFVDKSQTFNWNSNQTNPTWSSYPGGFPVPSPIDKYDFCVLFPQSEII